MISITKSFEKLLRQWCFNSFNLIRLIYGIFIVFMFYLIYLKNSVLLFIIVLLMLIGFLNKFWRLVKQNLVR